MIINPRPSIHFHDRSTSRIAILMITLIISVSTGALACGDRDDRVQIQSRAELLYRAAADGRWSEAYSVFLPRDKPETPIDRFITLFSNHRPFKCLAVQVRHLHDEDDPALVVGPEVGQRVVEVSMRLTVQYPDGRRETIRHYSDLWIKSQGVWYFASNRRGPYG